ncbi:hypothetical protein [Ornithinimicrobium cerasi]|uniref:hypothetical protein n=1 Tax=Ornithinimicrobium cerasi TaxID=2248773 RepID=UPI000EFF3293|nr:hypothetical protein [Ornithinimicrobium cerasi]
MALVSIDIGAMDALVSDLSSARRTCPQDASTIRSRLDHVLLGEGPVARLSWSSPIWTWMDDRVRDLNRRLALARIIAASTPGFPATGIVQIDEDYVSDLSPAQVEALADEVQQLMTPGDEYDFTQEIDPRLLDILREHAHDPYLARAIAQQVPPAELSAFLQRVNSGRMVEPGEDAVIAFDRRYDELLNGLGMAYGLASQGTGDLEVPGMAQAWSDTIQDAPSWSGTAHRLTLVISRGTFSTDLLLSVHDTLTAMEGDDGASFWGVAGMDLVIDPDLARTPGANILSDPMGALFQGLGNNPEALRRLFTTGPTVAVETDDGPAHVDAYLWSVLRERGMDEYAVGQLARGLQGGLTLPPVEGHPAWQPGLAEDLGAIGAALDREARIAEENSPPWWSSLGHSILDLGGMVPLLGEAADGLNGLWYLAEGNPVDAGLSFAGMVPFVGWFSVGGKWVRRTLNADELAALARAGDSGADLGRLLPGGRFADDATALTDPASFAPSQFLSPSELQRFADRSWLQNLVAGNRFDDYMAPHYRHNEIYLVAPDGRYVRLDSYVPGEQIVSRKLTQLGDVQTGTAFGYIDEVVTKYPPGTTIADVPSTRGAGIAGQNLDGTLVLQVPPQWDRTIPDEVAEYAYENGVRIIDVNGFDYTAHLFDAP